MSLIALPLAMALAALLLPRWCEDMRRTGLERTNYRGATLAFPLGALLVSVSLIALVPLALLDDMLGRGHAGDTARGWRDHARAVASGQLSTGAIKAVGSLGLAAFAVSGTGRELFGYIADLALLLLATNLFNLLDLRPGRVEKVLTLLLAGLCIGAWSVFPLELLGVFIGPLLVGAALTLREKAMLGDAGANLAGAIAGVALLVTLSEDARLIALVVVLVLTAYGEFRSISAAIERLPGLRQLDRIGRAPADAATPAPRPPA